MERDLLFVEGSGILLPSLIGHGGDEGSFNNTRFSGVAGFQNFSPPFHVAHDYGVSQLGFPETLDSDPTSFSYFTENLNLSMYQQEQNGENRLESIKSDSDKLKFVKLEQFDEEEITDTCTTLANFRSKNSGQISKQQDNSSLYLPRDLRSHEEASINEDLQVQNNGDLSVIESSQKRLRSSPSTDYYTLEAIVRNLSAPIPNPRSFAASLRAPNSMSRRPVIPPTALARLRREKISDRIRCLEKLMPWDKKMDMATTLEEVHKYIEFLKAQVSVLESMPGQSSLMCQFPSPSTTNVGIGGLFAGLEKLNRQQLLQVLVNSPAAQTVMYSKGYCVFSMEQLLSLKKIAARKILLHQLLVGPGLPY